jgi:flagellar motility protein MotE (MotC chaperone)
MKPGASTLLILMALSATGTAIANGASLTASVTSGGALSSSKAAAPTPRSRMGSRIEQELADRQALLDKRAKALDLREKAAKAAETRMSAQQPGRPTSGSAASVAGTAQAEPEPADGRGARFASLAAVYQAMKPKRAAPIMEQLAPDVQLGVARAMRERSLASIMTYMQPDKAARLSTALAGPAARKPTLAVRVP